MCIRDRHYQFWFSIVALHKLGAVAIPATNQLMKKDFVYRFNAAGIKAVLCTADGEMCIRDRSSAAHKNRTLAN